MGTLGVGGVEHASRADPQMGGDVMIAADSPELTLHDNQTNMARHRFIFR